MLVFRKKQGANRSRLNSSTEKVEKKPADRHQYELRRSTRLVAKATANVVTPKAKVKPEGSKVKNKQPETQEKPQVHQLSEYYNVVSVSTVVPRLIRMLSNRLVSAVRSLVVVVQMLRTSVAECCADGVTGFVLC